MRPHRASAFADAVPFERGPGHRTPATMLALDERDRFLREAAQRYCVGLSSRAAAAWLHVKLARYRESAWRRDRVETLCPPRLAGRIDALMWCVLKCSDRLMSERTIRALLSQNHGQNGHYVAPKKAS